MLKSKLHLLALAVVLTAVMPVMARTVEPVALGGPIDVENLDTGEFFATVQDAIDDSDTLDGHTLEMKVVSHVTSGTQVVFNKSLTLQGGAAGDTLMPGSDTGSSGDAKAWFLIDSGKTVTIRNLDFDGTGSLVYNAIRNHGELTVENCNFTEIKYNESGPDYAGVGITTFVASGALTVSGCTFSEIGRIGVHIFGDATVSGCTYTGKGTGNWLDYFICLDSQGASIGDANIESCTVSGNRGIAVSDGSWSAGMLISTYLGLGTTAVVSGSTFTNNITGVSVGVNGADVSSVDISDSNFSGNSFGVTNTSTTNIISAVDNYWGDPSGPRDLQGTNEADSPPCFPATFVLGTDVVNSDGAGDSVSNGNVDYCPWLDIEAPCISVDTAEDCEYLTSTFEGPDLADYNNIIVVHYNAGVMAGMESIDNVAFIEVRNMQFATYEIPGVAGGTVADPYNYALNVVLPAPTSDGSNLPPALLTLDSASGGIGEPGFGGVPALWTLDFYDGVNSPGDLAGSRDHTVLFGAYPDGVCDLVQTFASPFEQLAQTVFQSTDGIYHNVTDPEVFIPTATTWDGAAFATPVPGLAPGEPFFYSEAEQIDTGLYSDAPLLTGSSDPGFVTVWTRDFCTTDTLAAVATNRMGLDIVDPQTCYVQDDIIEVQLNMACLEEDVNVFFASVVYDPTLLSLEPTSAYTTSPFPLHILDPIMDSGAPVGTINLDGSAGLGMPGTSEDALLATLYFKVLPGGNGMPASIAFNTGGPFDSEFNASGSPVPTRLSNPPGFFIDDMGPTIMCPPDASMANDPGLCSALYDPGTPSVMDACGVASVVGVRSDALALDAPYPAGCAPGADTLIMWTATDCAGNTSMCVQTISVTDTEGPLITSTPADVTVNADAGGCSAVVTFTDPSATDACGGPITFDYSPPSGSSFPLGTTMVTCTAMDACGNASMPVMFEVEVLPVTEVTVTVELVGVRVGPVSRCIHFVGGDCSDTYDDTLVFVDHDSNLATPVQATTTFEIACGPNATLCAKDEQHTLWGSTTLSVVGTTFLGDTIISLEGGDTDNDGDCDATDVSWFLFQFGNFASPGGCPWDGTRDADFSDNGAVFTGDYAFLVNNYLTTSSCPCTVPSTAGGGFGSHAINRIATTRLPQDMRVLDRNVDGVFDHVDVRMFETEHGLPHALSSKMKSAR